MSRPPATRPDGSHRRPQGECGAASTSSSLRLASAPGALPDPDDHPVLREQTLDQLFRIGGAGLVGQLLDLFVGGAPEKIRAIRDGLAAASSEEARLAAHALKSSAGTLGAMRMWALCQRLESLAEQDDLGARFSDSLEQLVEEFGRVEPLLRSRVEASR